MTNKEAYRQLCQQQNNLPVFLHDWWLDAVCDNWDVAITKNGDNIAGVWPYAVSERLGVSLLRNTKLTPYLGPHVFFPADLKEANRDSFEHETIMILTGLLPKLPVWNLSLQPGMKQVGIFKLHRLKAQVQQTFLIDVTRDEQELFANMKENLRRNIRAAEGEFEITEAPQHLAELYGYQKHTLNNKGTEQSYTLADMQKLMDACRQRNSGTLWVAKKDNDIHALVWNVWDAHTSYYFMGAQKPGGDSYRAMSALLWHAIKQAKQRGNNIFDLEGSMDPGVEKFFRNFGGRRELYLVLRKNESWVWRVKELFRK